MSDARGEAACGSISIHAAVARSLQFLHCFLDRSRGFEVDALDVEQMKGVVLEADSMLFFARKLWSDDRSLQFFRRRCMTLRTKALLRLGSLTKDDRAADPLVAGTALVKEVDRYRDRFGFELACLKDCTREDDTLVGEYIRPDIRQIAYEIRLNLDRVVSGERQVLSPHLCLLSRRMAVGIHRINGQSAPLMETMAAMFEVDWRVCGRPTVGEKTSRRVALWWKIHRPDFDRLMS